MSIIHKILDYDLHKIRENSSESRVLFIETPIKKEFLPCVVSSPHKGRWLINNSITSDNRLRSGAFFSSEESLDEILPGLFEKCYELSLEKQYANIFKSINTAIEYIQGTSGYKNQPHFAFLPNSFSKTPSNRDIKDGMIGKTCRVVFGEYSRCVFVSRPDYVGLLTRLPNNYNSVAIHNVELGLAFV